MHPLPFEIPPHLRREFAFQTAGILPPNGILFGFGTVQKTGEKAARLGGQRAILITDAHMVQLGPAGLVKESLEKGGLKVEVFDQVEPEPHIETAEAVCSLLRGKKIDLVVGLGGGSCLDVAKLAALAAGNDLPPWELAARKKEAGGPGLKKILIPTTAGTGSEVSHAMVLAKGKEKYAFGSPYAFPEVAIIDPGLTVTMPAKVTAVSGIDALSHAVDGIMNKVVNPFAEAIAFSGIELIGKYLRRAFFNGQDVEDRYYMSLAATTSMIAMGQKGSALYSHAMAYVLAAFQPMPHGVACALSLPYTMAFNRVMIEDKMSGIARALGERTEFLSPRDAARRAPGLVLELMADLKLPLSLKEIGIRRGDLPEMAKICMGQYRRENNPRPMDLEDCLAVFEAMWEGRTG